MVVVFKCIVINAPSVVAVIAAPLVVVEEAVRYLSILNVYVISLHDVNDTLMCLYCCSR